MLIKRINKVILILYFLAGTVAHAQIVTGHYGPGLFGMRSAHGFPMGWSYVNVTHMYYAGEMKDNEGKISSLAKPVNVIANVSAGIWGRTLDQIGANFNAALVLPFANLALNPETLELDPERVGLGDIMAIPLMLTWNLDRITLNTRYGLWIPTGSYEAGSISNSGKGFWSHNLGLGVTVYVDKNKSWSVSSMNTLELNSRQKSTEIRPASNLVSEWSAGKTFDRVFNLGLVGYLNYQIGRQDGRNVPDGTHHYKVNGLGMEFSYRTANKWVFITRWYLEYLAVNRPEGTAIHVSFC